METVAKRLYEGMFLVDSAQATADWDGTLSVINNILQRADAEVVAMRKWQERKLAYDIDHKSRGTYILCYFKAEGPRISGIEKDVLLSEKVIRALILTTEKRPAEMLESDITGEPVEKPGEASEGGEAKPAEAPAAQTPQPEQTPQEAEAASAAEAPQEVEAAPAAEAPQEVEAAPAEPEKSEISEAPEAAGSEEEKKDTDETAG